MNKQILSVGIVLTKANQKEIKGGNNGTFHYPQCKCDAHGNIINAPCDGGCIRKEEEPPLESICDVYPDFC
ncbi:MULTISPECIES: hypothetical protein [Tenacibaculum]|uniref:hypothetical protein n=1 Tax=Tenacibaculum TaxID=104267 RepID=UPI0008961511|nr:hypothetical protein [Tenacibaculum sp. MAR_2010_89]SEE13411.1 hypothetical protein SAMN04487765_1512 [Tenacibaculum sp. MAR_2010_89]